MLGKVSLKLHLRNIYKKKTNIMLLNQEIRKIFELLKISNSLKRALKKNRKNSMNV